MNARWTPHVTVAAVIEEQGRYLLVEEHTRDGLRLNNPAGHLDPGESPVEGCAREALEETARLFEPTHLVGLYLSRSQSVAVNDSPDIHYLRLAFAGRHGEVIAGRALDTGIVRTVWMTLPEIEATQHLHRSALVWRTVCDHAAGRRYSLDMLYSDASVYRV